MLDCNPSSRGCLQFNSVFLQPENQYHTDSQAVKKKTHQTETMNMFMFPWLNTQKLSLVSDFFCDNTYKNEQTSLHKKS